MKDANKPVIFEQRKVYTTHKKRVLDVTIKDISEDDEKQLYALLDYCRLLGLNVEVHQRIKEMLE